MFEKILKILTTKIPTWLGVIIYAFALVETILLVVGYFNPDLFVDLLMRL